MEDDTIQFVSRVKRVFPIGPAADSKRIQAGDVILLVNGKDMRRHNHSVSNTFYIEDLILSAHVLLNLLN